MGLLASISTCYRKIFTYSGRASRSEFWWFFLALFVISSVIQTFVSSQPGQLNIKFSLNFNIGTETSWLENLFTIVFLPPFIAVLVRRLHDVSRSGYQALIGLAVLAALLGGTIYLSIYKVQIAPFIIGISTAFWFIYLIVVLATKSHPKNRYGPPPLKALQTGSAQHPDLPR